MDGDKMTDMFGNTDWCWITQKNISKDELKDCRFTMEFDAFVSKEGQEILAKAAEDGTLDDNPEWRFIWDEFQNTDGGGLKYGNTDWTSIL